MTVLRAISCDAKRIPGWEWRDECTATFGPHTGTKAEVRAEASDDGWSREGKLDLCPEHTCPFIGMSHTRDWCGYPYCRES